MGDVETFLERWRVQSRFSEPGRFADLLEPIPADPATLSALARNVIVHYRASGHALPRWSQGDINLRWIARLLDTDQSRHRAPLQAPRSVVDRAQGCCRDQTLLCVSVLRAHGVPARSRVGFAGYFVDGWHHDHVVVEMWTGERWQLFDPGLSEPASEVPDPTDMTWSPATGHGFVSAAHAWLAYRQGLVDAETFGVDPSVPVRRGPRFLFNEVIIEIAHRAGDELLLWDSWGRIDAPQRPVSGEDAAWLDEIAELLSAADEGAGDAEEQVLARYASDAGLHPGETVLQASPLREEPVIVPLQTPHV